MLGDSNALNYIDPRFTMTDGNVSEVTVLTALWANQNCRQFKSNESVSVHIQELWLGGYLPSTLSILSFLLGRSFMDRRGRCGRIQTECLQAVCFGSKLSICYDFGLTFGFIVQTRFGIQEY